MKLTNMLLLERTLDYNSDEFLQAVQIAKRVSRTSNNKEEKAVATMALSLDRLQKEIYEFWGQRLGAKQDLIAQAGIRVPSNYKGRWVPKQFLTTARRVMLLEQPHVNMLFPPKIAKLIARGKELFDSIFDTTRVVLSSDYDKSYLSTILIATTIDAQEFDDLLSAADTWISLMSRVEFYDGSSGSQFFAGKESIKEEYHNSDVTSYVKKRHKEIMEEKTNNQEVGHEDLLDFDNDMLVAIALMEMIISECLDLTSTFDNSTPITEIEYEIDPKTKMVKKYKNKQGKMVPVVHLNTKRTHDGGPSQTYNVPVSSRSTIVDKRYTFNMDGSSPIYREFRALVHDIELSLKTIVSLMSEVKWWSEEKLHDKWGKLIDVEFAISVRDDEFDPWGEEGTPNLPALKKIRWEHQIQDILSSESNEEQYSETNPPKEMIEIFQQAEREIVFLAKLLMWL